MFPLVIRRKCIDFWGYHSIASCIWLINLLMSLVEFEHILYLTYAKIPLSIFLVLCTASKNWGTIYRFWHIECNRSYQHFICSHQQQSDRGKDGFIFSLPFKNFTLVLLLKQYLFVLFKLAIKSWHIIGDGLAIELLTTEKGNRTTIIANHHELQNATASDQSSVSNSLNLLLKARFWRWIKRCIFL